MVAVTGANGLLGSFIVRRLLETNETFVALKRKGSDVSLLNDIASRITWRDGDVTDPVSMDEALKGVTKIIHAAATVSFHPKDKKKIFQVNVEGTKNVLNAAHAHGIKKFVHISSVAALGRMKGQAEVNENNKWISSTLNTNYAESKYLAELEVFRAHEEGLNAVVINPSIILAPADWNKSSAKLFKYVWKQSRFYIDSYLNYVDVRDVAMIACRLLNSDHSGERFIVNAGQISFLNFFNAIAKRFNKRAPSINLSRRALNFVATVETVRSFLTNSEPLITRETARLSGAQFFYQNQKIKNALNVDFQSIDQSLDWCCKYYMLQADR
jgi:dihydroflavonol-4-reductase